MLKHLGLFAIACMWLGTYFLLKHHTLDREKSISKHASKNHKYHVTYGLLELAVTGIFAIFMLGWFIPNFELGGGYVAAALVGLVGTVVAAFIPDRKGWQTKVHALGAYSMAISLAVMNLLLFTNDNVSTLTQISVILALFYMIPGWILAIFYTKHFKKNMLKLQVLYFLAFQIPILVATYS